MHFRDLKQATCCHAVAGFAKAGLENAKMYHHKAVVFCTPHACDSAFANQALGCVAVYSTHADTVFKTSAAQLRSTSARSHV